MQEKTGALECDFALHSSLD